MLSKIDDELMKRLEELGRAESKGEVPQEIPVIISVTPEVDLSQLEAAGFKLERKFKNISAVAGALPADKNRIQEITNLASVISIEYDGEMHAFSD